MATTHSFTLVNKLHAQLQGRFVCQNVLGQLGQPAPDVDALKAALDTLGPLGPRVIAGEDLLLPAASRAPEAQRAVALARELVATLLDHGGRLARVLTARPFAATPEAAALCVGSDAWQCYAFEHEIRGTLAMAQQQGLHEEADRMQQYLPQARQAIAAVHRVLDFARDVGDDAAELARIPEFVAPVHTTFFAEAGNLARALVELGEPEPVPGASDPEAVVAMMNAALA